VSEFKRGKFIGILVPSEWRIRVVRKPDGLYSLDYVEVFERPPDMDGESFLKIVESTVEFAKQQFKVVDVEVEANVSHDDQLTTCTVAIRMEGSLNSISSALAGEFFSFTDTGDLTVRELAIFGGIGYQVLKGFLKGKRRGEKL
jgi:hypothetical protein